MAVILHSTSYLVVKGMLLSYYMVHPTWWSKVSCCHFTWYILLGGQRYVVVILHSTSYLVVKGMLLLFYMVHPTWWSKVCCCHFT